MRDTRHGVLAFLVAALVATACMAADDGRVAVFHVVDDEIPESLTGRPGDPMRGRAIAAGREGNCLACHHMPIPEEQFHGDLGPDLAGIGARLSEGALRLRLVDPKLIDTESIMPAFHAVDGLERVAQRYQGRPILTAEQIEDIVAYLKTLTE